MIFPIGDTQVKGGSFPYFSYGFIGVNILIFLAQYTSGNLLIQHATVPAEILNGEDYYTLFSSMFMHGSIMHLVGNMVFLWVFADNIEATVGNFNFLVFYLLGGLAASAAHIYFNASSTIPSLGASGAISAVLGAYLVMFPKSKIKTLVLYFFLQIPAFIFLGIWIIQQLYSGIGAISPGGEAGGVAWWAHIGGFVFGVIAGFFARSSKPGTRPPKIRRPSRGEYV